MVATGGWLVLTAGPAAAQPSTGWPDSEPVAPVDALLILVGIPLALVVVIWALVYIPSILRREKVSGGSGKPRDEWLGGPRRGSDELAAPDSDTSRAGGASGRW